MITKTKIKSLIIPGMILCKSELIEKIQFYLEKYDNGSENMKHIVIGFFMSLGLTHPSATKAFEKIQELKDHGPIESPCIVCGEPWDASHEPCLNCGNDAPF